MFTIFTFLLSPDR